MTALESPVPGIVDVSQIGVGGYGRVFRGRQPAFDREVAVKMLDGRVEDEATKRRFDRECRILGSLSGHPNIVELHGAGVAASGRPYLVMAYVPRGSLSSELARNGPMPWASVVRTGIKLSAALHVAHLAGVLHRDIKPGNVLLSDFGEPMLADFGIAIDVTHSFGTTTTSALTPSYGAPELFSDCSPSVASDVYALSATLWAALTGRAPFDPEPGSSERGGGNVVALMVRIVTQPPPDLRPSGVPDSLAQVLEGALAKDPARRPDSALAFGRALQNVERTLGLPLTPMALPGEESPFTDPDFAAQAGRTGKRRISRRNLMIAGSAVAVAAVAGGVVSTVSGRGRDSADHAVGLAPGSRRPTASPTPSGVSRTITRATYSWPTANAEPASRVRFTPDGKRIAVLESTRVLTVHTVADGSRVMGLATSTIGFWSFTLDPSGTRIATGLASVEKIEIWDLATGALLTFVQGRTGGSKVVGEVEDIAYSPDGTVLASGGAGRTVRIWDLRSRRVRQTLKGPAGSVFRVAFRPGTYAGGLQVAGGGIDPQIRIWNTVTGATTTTLTVPGGGVRTLAFSPDGTAIAAGGWDGAVRVWDVGTGRLRHTMTGHENQAESVVFSPDGTRLATIGLEDRARIWDVASGGLLTTITTGGQDLWSLAWSPDGTLLAGGGDRNVFLWSV
ncbi:MAG: serine/threonine-protein kinase PknK [Actinomycetota bacterium]|nr:serine/threonine-protein kinase PknK [Actinomycetota bacterium]